MRKLIAAAAVVAAAGLTAARADDPKPDPAAVLDKAAKALGVADKPMPAVLTKSKLTISVMGMDVEADTATTAQGIDHVRSEFAGDFGGNKVDGVTVIAGDKGWRSFNGDVMDLDADAVATEKRNLYLAAVSVNPAVMKGKGFKVAAADEMVDGKPAAVVAGTGPDGKEFKAYFDKGTGLPVKLTAPKVAGFGGDEADQVWTYTEYKDFGGVKRPAKTTVTRGGEKFLTQQLTEFKVLDKADAKLFDKP
ncbi:MAG: hypothetical protein K2X87_09670 [Gemmataceae bacterium]|nr:hypothetical protein [Gemmataceae bacterium]